MPASSSKTRSPPPTVQFGYVYIRAKISGVKVIIACVAIDPAPNPTLRIDYGDIFLSPDKSLTLTQHVNADNGPPLIYIYLYILRYLYIYRSCEIQCVSRDPTGLARTWRYPRKVLCNVYIRAAPCSLQLSLLKTVFLPCLTQTRL